MAINLQAKIEKMKRWQERQKPRRTVKAAPRVKFTRPPAEEEFKAFQKVALYNRVQYIVAAQCFYCEAIIHYPMFGFLDAKRVLSQMMWEKGWRITIDKIQGEVVTCLSCQSPVKPAEDESPA